MKLHHIIVTDSMSASQVLMNVISDSVLPLSTVTVTFSNYPLPLLPTSAYSNFDCQVTSYISYSINMTGFAIDHQFKPHQLASLRQMSKTVKTHRTCPRETGPGAAPVQDRNSKFWLNVANEYLGKVTKFQLRTSNGFPYSTEKLPGGGGRFGPPHQ